MEISRNFFFKVEREREKKVYAPLELMFDCSIDEEEE